MHGFDEFLGNLYHLNAEEEPETYYYPKDPEFRKKFGPRGVLHCFADGKGGQKIEDTGPLTARACRPSTWKFMTPKRSSSTRRSRTRSRSSSGSTPRACTSGRTSRKRREGATGIGLYPDGMVEHDDMVGEVLKQLDDLGIADNTIVVYGTDNGAETVTWPDGGTTPFHGEKGTTWEGGFRVPMLVRWPGVIKPGTIVNDIFSQEDWMPTLLAAAGEPDIVEKLKKGYQANGKTFKVHARRLQLPALLQGRGSKRPARGDLLLRSGRRTERRALERLEGPLRRRGREHRHGVYAKVTGLAGDRQPAGRPLREGASRVGHVYPLVWRQHLALRAGAAEAQGVSATIPEYPFQQGSSLNAANINYMTLKAAAGHQALKDVESLGVPQLKPSTHCSARHHRAPRERPDGMRYAILRAMSLAAVVVVFVRDHCACRRSLALVERRRGEEGLLDFVAKVTKADGPDFVPPADRIATFDNDGTLWAEQPMYFQLIFALDRVKALAPQHPEWKAQGAVRIVAQRRCQRRAGRRGARRCWRLSWPRMQV